MVEEKQDFIKLKSKQNIIERNNDGLAVKQLLAKFSNYQSVLNH